MTLDCVKWMSFLVMMVHYSWLMWMGWMRCSIPIMEGKCRSFNFKFTRPKLFSSLVIVFFLGSCFLLSICGISFIYKTYMGGDRNRIKPSSYEKWQNEQSIWDKISSSGITHYLEKLHGHDPLLTKSFLDGCQGRIIQVYKVKIYVIEDLIQKVPRMSVEGNKFYRECKASDEAVNLFFKGVEWNMVKRSTNEGYE